MRRSYLQKEYDRLREVQKKCVIQLRDLHKIKSSASVKANSCPTCRKMYDDLTSHKKYHQMFHILAICAERLKSCALELMNTNPKLLLRGKAKILSMSKKAFTPKKTQGLTPRFLHFDGGVVNQYEGIDAAVQKDFIASMQGLLVESKTECSYSLEEHLPHLIKFFVDLDITWDGITGKLPDSRSITNMVRFVQSVLSKFYDNQKIQAWVLERNHVGLKPCGDYALGKCCMFKLTYGVHFIFPNIVCSIPTAKMLTNILTHLFSQRFSSFPGAVDSQVFAGQHTSLRPAYARKIVKCGCDLMNCACHSNRGLRPSVSFYQPTMFFTSSGKNLFRHRKKNISLYFEQDPSRFQRELSISSTCSHADPISETPAEFKGFILPYEGTSHKTEAVYITDTTKKEACQHLIRGFHLAYSNARIDTISQNGDVFFIHLRKPHSGLCLGRRFRGTIPKLRSQLVPQKHSANRIFFMVNLSRGVLIASCHSAQNSTKCSSKSLRNILTKKIPSEALKKLKN